MQRTNYGLLRETIYNLIDKDAHKKKNPHTGATTAFDPEIFNKGIEWYQSGLPIEDAPEELKNNAHFVNGYEKGKRLAKIEELQNNDTKRR